MRTTVSHVRSVDEVIEIRDAIRDHVRVSHINYSQLNRVTRTRARLHEVQGDARRIGLFEVSLAPESVTHHLGRLTTSSGPIDKRAERNRVPPDERLVSDLAMAKFACRHRRATAPGTIRPREAVARAAPCCSSMTDAASVAGWCR